MAFYAAFENGPAARSFAADAYDCIMVRSGRTCRIQGCGALRRARKANSPWITSQAAARWNSRAAVLASVKNKPSAALKKAPSLTATARDGKAHERSGRKNARGPGRTKECRLKK